MATNFVPLSSLRTYVSNDILGVPVELLDQQVLLSAIDFCQKTLLWTEILPDIPAVSGQSTYTLSLPYANTALAGVKQIWVNGRELAPKPYARLAYELMNWQTATATSPVFYAMPDLLSFSPLPIPTNFPVAFSFRVRVALMPNSSAVQLPEIIGDRFSDALAYGARARLMAMPNKNWSDQKTAMYYQAKYNEEFNRAKIEGMQNIASGSLQVNSRRFA